MICQRCGFKGHLSPGRHFHLCERCVMRLDLTDFQVAIADRINARIDALEVRRHARGRRTAYKKKKARRSRRRP